MTILQPTHVDALIFDLDGTLWDANLTYLMAWNNTITQAHPELNLTLDALKSVMGWEQKAAWNQLFPQLTDPEWKALAVDIDKIQVELSRTKGGMLYPGVREGIARLSKKYQLAIVSNCPEGLIPAFYDFSGMRSYFVDYEEHGRTHASKAENIKMVVERNHLKNPIYIGDTDSDRKNATLAGVPFVYMTYGFAKITAPAAMEFDGF